MCKEVKIRILISCSLKATRAVCVRETEKERERESGVCVWKRWLRERERVPSRAGCRLPQNYDGRGEVDWGPGIGRPWGTAPSALKPSAAQRKMRPSRLPGWQGADFLSVHVDSRGLGLDRQGSQDQGRRDHRCLLEEPADHPTQDGLRHIPGRPVQVPAEEWVDPPDAERTMRHSQEEQNANWQTSQRPLRRGADGRRVKDLKGLSLCLTGLPCWLSGKESVCSAGDTGDEDSTPGWGRSPGGGHGNPLQYSCLEDPMDRGAWWSTVHAGL